MGNLKTSHAGVSAEKGHYAAQSLCDRVFVEAQLAGVSFVDSDLTRANFTGALLAGADFGRANLTRAIFDGADLTGAHFDDANLTHTSLKRARLEGSGIEDVHMPGANLAGAIGVSLQKKLESRLGIAKDQAERLRSVLIAVFAFFGYIGPTALATKDALLLTNLTTMELPLIGAKVSVRAFFLLSGASGIAILSYLLSLVGHFSRVVSRLPAHLPDGPPLREQVDTWVLGCVGVLREPDLPLLGQSKLAPAARRIFEALGGWFPSILARWIGPATLSILLYRFFVACRWDQSAVTTDLTFVALVALYFSAWTIAFALTVYSQLVDGVQPSANWKLYAVGAVAILCLIVAGRIGLGKTLLFGVPNEDLQRATLTGARLRDWNMAGARLDEANLANAELIGAHLQEAVLTGADLRHTSVERATFSEADLTKAQLVLVEGQFANFCNANLTQSDLREANLPNSIFQNARVTDARLQKANLEGAIASLADFSRSRATDAIFDHAQLNGAHFVDTILFNASFVGANLGTADMSGSRLFGARLDRSDLTDTSFSGARVTNATFREAWLLRTVFGVVEMFNADLSGATLRDLVISPGANLSGVNFTGATLENVTLSGVNLYKANFSQATISASDLTGTNLVGAQFHGTRWKDSNLTKADLYVVDATRDSFRNIDLTGATNVRPELMETP